jgi:hypothetical protein
MRPNGTIIGILGLLLIVAGIIGLGSVGNVWSHVIVGIIVSVLGFAMASTTPAHGISTGILGLWMIFSAFIPGLRSGAGARWDHIIVGVILAIAGFSTPRRLATSSSDFRRAS